MMASALDLPPLGAAVLFLAMTFFSFFSVVVTGASIRGSGCAA
jgi:hypothetical protein